MKKCTIVGHNGWTDYISQYSLRRHFIEGFDQCILFIDSQDKYTFVRSLYPEKHIDIQVPKTTPIYDGIHSCICCHTLGSPQFCPRSKQSCKFIDYNQYTDYTHIKLNAFDNYLKWQEFFANKSFLTSMYAYYNLDPIETIQKYKLPLDTESNEAFFESFYLPKDYIAIHDNKATGLYIHLKTPYLHVQMDGISQSITDTLLILQKAKEIHCIDSVYLFLIIMYNIQYGLFKNKPVFVYLRSFDTNGPFFAIESYLPHDWFLRILY